MNTGTRIRKTPSPTPEEKHVVSSSALARTISRLSVPSVLPPGIRSPSRLLHSLFRGVRVFSRTAGWTQPGHQHTTWSVGSGCIFCTSQHSCLLRYQFRNAKKASLQELGPRFTLKLRSLQKGTFDSKYGEYEWVHKVTRARARVHLVSECIQTRRLAEQSPLGPTSSRSCVCCLSETYLCFSFHSTVSATGRNGSIFTTKCRGLEEYSLALILISFCSSDMKWRRAEENFSCDIYFAINIVLR